LLPGTGCRHNLGAARVDADHLAPVEQQHQAHAVKASVGAIGVTAEDV